MRRSNPAISAMSGPDSAMDGLERILQGKYPNGTRLKSLGGKLPSVNFIRYADDFIITSRSAPTLAELRINVGYTSATLFKVTLKRDDGTYYARLDNQLKDSNGDLRLAFNTAAFPAGVYDVDLEAVNLRGEGELVGRLRLRIDGGAD